MPTAALANTTRTKVQTPDNIYHSPWALLFQQITIWYIQCSRTLPEENEHDTRGVGRSFVSDRRCLGIW